MSFGFSPSDIITLVTLATKTFRGWKNACGDYADITGSLDTLLILLERVEDEAEQEHTALLRNRKERDELNDIISACHKTVQELGSIISKYRSLGLGKSREKNWDKIRFGNKNLDSLKAKLLQHQSALSAYLNAIGLGALSRIERDLHALPDKIQRTVDGLAAEIRAGRREGSIMTTYEDDEKEVWKQFRRELIGDGMKSSFVHKYKPQIRNYLRALANQGLLEEVELPSDYEATPDQSESELTAQSSERDSNIPKAPLAIDLRKSEPAEAQGLPTRAANNSSPVAILSTDPPTNDMHIQQTPLTPIQEDKTDLTAHNRGQPAQEPKTASVDSPHEDPGPQTLDTQEHGDFSKDHESVVTQSDAEAVAASVPPGDSTHDLKPSTTSPDPTSLENDNIAGSESARSDLGLHEPLEPYEMVAMENKNFKLDGNNTLHQPTCETASSSEVSDSEVLSDGALMTERDPSMSNDQQLDNASPTHHIEDDSQAIVPALPAIVNKDDATSDAADATSESDPDSSGSDYERVIIEGLNGRRTVYLSKEQQSDLIQHYQRQKMGGKTLVDLQPQELEDIQRPKSEDSPRQNPEDQHKGEWDSDVSTDVKLEASQQQKVKCALVEDWDSDASTDVKLGESQRQKPKHALVEDWDSDSSRAVSDAGATVADSERALVVGRIDQTSAPKPRKLIFDARTVKYVDEVAGESPTIFSRNHGRLPGNNKDSDTLAHTSSPHKPTLEELNRLQEEDLYWNCSDAEDSDSWSTMAHRYFPHYDAGPTQNLKNPSEEDVDSSDNASQAVRPLPSKKKMKNKVSFAANDLHDSPARAKDLGFDSGDDSTGPEYNTIKSKDHFPVMTLLPKSIFTFHAIKYHDVCDIMFMGYSVRGAIAEHEIAELFKASRQERPDIITQPFHIKVEGPVPSSASTTWFPKLAFSMWTMLALARPVEQLGDHYLVRGRFTRKELDTTLAVNNRIAEGLTYYNPVMHYRDLKHLHHAWRDVTLNGNPELFLWLSSKRNIWQVCGPAPIGYNWLYSYAREQVQVESNVRGCD